MNVFALKDDYTSPIEKLYLKSDGKDESENQNENKVSTMKRSISLKDKF